MVLDLRSGLPRGKVETLRQGSCLHRPNLGSGEDRTDDRMNRLLRWPDGTDEPVKIASHRRTISR
jgi:hypothetical protein